MSTQLQGPVLDREVALARVGGDLELLKELAALFLQEAPHMLEELQSAAGDGNSKEVERVAHGLKGSAANFGATAVMETARELEFLGRDEKTAAFPGALKSLESALSTLQGELAAL